MPSHLRQHCDPIFKEYHQGLLEISLPGHQPHSSALDHWDDPLDCELRTVPLPRGFYGRLLGLAGELDYSQWQVPNRD